MTHATESMVDASARDRPLKRPIYRVFEAIGRSPAMPLLVILVGFFSFANPHFLTWLNFSSVLTQTVVVGLLAIGLTPVIISGKIDLSVGAVAGFSACLLAYLETPFNVWVAVVITILAGTLIGFVNGFIVEKLGLNSIIVTLAMATGISGITFLTFDNNGTMAPDMTLLTIVGTKFGPISMDVVLFLLVAVLTGIMLRFTLHGLNTQAIGSNRTAAVDAGVNVTTHTVINFAFAGAIAGLVGVVLIAELGAASPIYGRQNYELWAIIAVVLGGTKISGGRGTILGTVIAAIFLTMLQNGMNLMQIEPRYVMVAMGVALLCALLLDRLLSGEPETAE
jgi:ribose transport system permease protein